MQEKIEKKEREIITTQCLTLNICSNNKLAFSIISTNRLVTCLFN